MGVVSWWADPIPVFDLSGGETAEEKARYREWSESLIRVPRPKPGERLGWEEDEEETPDPEEPA